jgi:hypothetical protein
MATAEGQAWDYRVDTIVNPLFFVGAGIGLRHSVLGDYAVPLGLIAGTAVFLGAYWSKALEQRRGGEAKAYGGAFGFDFDDMLYLLAPLAWFGWLAPIIVGAAVGGTSIALLTAWRLHRVPRHQVNRAGDAAS